MKTKPIFAIFAILSIIGITTAISYTDTYLFKPSSTYQAALKNVYISTDGTLKATNQSDATLQVEWFNSATTAWTAQDTTPDVSANTVFTTPTSATIVNIFDGGTTGQKIYVISKSSYSFGSTGNLKVGSATLTTDSLDVTGWVFDGTLWYLTSYFDNSDDNN